MKKMSKFLSLAVAAVMTLCLCSFGVIFEASADTVSTLTINKPAGSTLSFVGHTYTAYKVFDATINGTGDAYTYSTGANCLSPSGYGDDYKPSNDSINSAAKARAFGEYLMTNYIVGKTPAAYSSTVGPIATDSNTVSIPVEQAGYYLIVDSYSGSDSVVSLVMLDTLAKTNESIVVKADPASTLTKKVKDDAATPAWGTVTDTEIGENAEYKLTAKIPLMDIEEYTNNYTFKIEDVLDAGLTYNNDVAVYTDENKTTAIAATNYSVTAPNPAADNKLIIDFTAHIKELAPTLKGQNIYIFYTAKLNGNAKYATTAVDSANFNKNAAKLIYSKSPYSTELLETAANLTYDWTFGITFQKVNRKGLANLPGAKFKITSNSTDLTFTLKPGSNGVYYRDPASANTELICNTTDGSLIVYGLDDDTDYQLVETAAPDGFGVGGSAVFRISGTTYGSDGATLDTISYSVTGQNVVESNATVEAGVNYTPVNPNPSGDVTVTGNSVKFWNSSGTELIGTGGIGTTIFYIVGGILMVGAAILLLTKLRMKNKD